MSIESIFVLFWSLARSQWAAHTVPVDEPPAGRHAVVIDHLNKGFLLKWILVRLVHASAGRRHKDESLVPTDVLVLLPEGGLGTLRTTKLKPNRAVRPWTPLEVNEL